MDKGAVRLKGAAGVSRALKALVRGLGLLSGACVVAMTGVTTVDVIARSCFNHPVTGAYDIVKLLSAAALFAALPYTTAVKGHVAVEYFFHKLGRRPRIVVDCFNRVLTTSLCLVLSYFSFAYGTALRDSGEVTLTLQIPLWPAAFAAGISLFLVACVMVYHLSHPGQELIHP
ncbi:MAG: TRAP transporter small permease [Lentisphaeria bacterium]|nr:TRAP transporter small permease [Lentisphaeria bacterium]